MYVFATPDDGQICKACWEANGMVYLPSQVANKDFVPRSGPCANSGRCTIVMAGMYGAWLEARNVVHRLRAAGRTGSLKLSAQELSELLKGNWEQSVSAATDRLAVLMLAALSGEKKNPEAAINAYRLAIREAKEVHDLPLVVPAYLRLAEVLVNMSRTDAARAHGDQEIQTQDRLHRAQGLGDAPSFLRLPGIETRPPVPCLSSLLANPPVTLSLPKGGQQSGSSTPHLG